MNKITKQAFGASIMLTVLLCISFSRSEFHTKKVSTNATTGVKHSLFTTHKKTKQVITKKDFTHGPITHSIKKRILGKSFQQNETISLKDLRYVEVKYVDFNGNTKTGELIVHKDIAKDIVEIFYELYQARYPIANIELIDNYDADDEKSMAANNTSAFNYRKITGSTKLSVHSYGKAIDINPIQNPYVKNKMVLPSKGNAYLDRNQNEVGMIKEGDLCWTLFTEHGFTWGGSWTSLKDYQHFEKK